MHTHAFYLSHRNMNHSLHTASEVVFPWYVHKKISCVPLVQTYAVCRRVKSQEQSYRLKLGLSFVFAALMLELLFI